MKRILLATLVGMFAVTANAALWCKNDEGQTYKWRINDPRPVDSANFKNQNHLWPAPIFNTQGNVVCFLNGQLYRDVASNTLGIRGFPVLASIPFDLVEGVNLGDNSAGVVYRGDQARWLIDNLPSAYGQYATKAYYDSINP